MSPDRPSNTRQEDEVVDLLCIALDGTDTDRVRYLVQLLAMRQDPRSDADHARLRETMAAMFRPI